MESQPFTAVYTLGQLDKREKEQNGWNITRRAALAVLTRDHAQLAESVQDDEEVCDAFLDLVKDIRALQDMRKIEGELIDAAHARLLFVLTAEAERTGAMEAA